MKTAATYVDHWFKWTALALILSMLSACQTTDSAGNLDSAPELGPVLLSEGDVVRVSFPNSPELSFAQTIQADGMLNLPMVGEFKAAGKSPEKLQQELKSKFSAHLRDSNVLVTVESTSAVIYVSGAVRSPGKISLSRRMTVFEAIMEAGGFAQGANQRKVTIVRNVDGRHQTMTVDLSRVMKNQTMDASYVRPYDTILVGESIF